MFCEKCGSEISEKDLFCEKCGTRLKQSNVNNETSPKKKRILIKCIIGGILLVVCGFAFVLFSEKEPKTYNMEASELALIMTNEKEMENYYEDNLYVHGYISRGTGSSIEEENIYTLYSDINDSNFVTFSYDNGLSEDIGTGSEVVLKGKLGYFTESKQSVLLVSEIEIKEKVETVYEVGDVSELVNNATKYIDKKVIVGGIPYERDGGTLYLNDESFASEVIITDVDKYALGEDAWDYLYVKGTLRLYQGALIIEVEELTW